MAFPNADLILLNGRVFCGLGEAPAQALAVWGDRILAVGTEAEIKPLRGPATRVVDLRGRLATAGLYEAHLHLLPLGLTMAELDVRPRRVRTLKGLLGLIREEAARTRPGKWVLARGYDQIKLDAAPPRARNRPAAPNNPVKLVRTCGHIAIVTSGVTLAGIDRRRRAARRADREAGGTADRSAGRERPR